MACGLKFGPTCFGVSSIAEPEDIAHSEDSETDVRVPDAGCGTISYVCELAVLLCERFAIRLRPCAGCNLH